MNLGSRSRDDDLLVFARRESRMINVRLLVDPEYRAVPAPGSGDRFARRAPGLMPGTVAECRAAFVDAALQEVLERIDAGRRNIRVRREVVVRVERR